MDPFSTAPDFILDLIFLKLNEEDLHETLRVSKPWFWASIRRTKKLLITSKENPLKSMAKFYNQHSLCEEEIDWFELFKHLVLDELVVSCDETTNYLVNNGCNTAGLTIEASREATPVTLASLTRVTRLQSFEFCIIGSIDWHPFISECFKTSDCQFDPYIVWRIEAIKLNSSGWNTDDSVLHSVTKLSVTHASTEFVRTMVDHCPNLKELHCSLGVITQDWHQVFTSNIKRIELHDFGVYSDVSTVVEASADSARHLLQYLCQNWESVEKFHFDSCNYWREKIVYQAFPQQREEVLDCAFVTEGMDFASPLFQCRKIRVKCDGRIASELIIPPAKSVKLEFYIKGDFKFSPRDVCLEPGKVERLSLWMINRWMIVTLEPFGPNSFDGFSCLTSLTLSRVSTLSITLALDQCPSIKKLKLKYLKASTIGNIVNQLSYANVCELVLQYCEEPMDKVFHVFPCLSDFKQSDWGKHEMRSNTTDWLWRHLIAEDKMFGLVFQRTDEVRYMVSDDLQASLSQAQKFLNEFLEIECYVKGFKLIPRFSTQKMMKVQ